MNKRNLVTTGGPLRFLLHALALEALILAYFGPDTVMPLGSALAAGIGVILMFWHRGLRVLRATIQRFTGAKADPRRDEE